jgi:hypothetical protein
MCPGSFCTADPFNAAWCLFFSSGILVCPVRPTYQTQRRARERMPMFAKGALFVLARPLAATKDMRSRYAGRVLSGISLQLSASSPIAFGFNYFSSQNFFAKRKEVIDKDSNSTAAALRRPSDPRLDSHGYSNMMLL